MDEYYYDEDDDGNYNDQLEADEAMLNYAEGNLTIENLYDACIRPSTIQIVYYIGTFLAWNFLFRLTTQSGILKYFNFY